MLKYMLTKKADKDAIETLKFDFCNKFTQTIPKRTAFIQSLKLKSDSEFESACLNELKTQQGINEWFDPIDPIPSISSQEICDIHKKLFTSLKSKSITSLAEYVSFSYLVTLDLYLNAN